jgi:hypothetical protein
LIKHIIMILILTILNLFFVSEPIESKQEYCEINIPVNVTWKGQTQNSFQGKSGTNENTTIDRLSDNAFLISDFTANLFKQFGYDKVYSIEITIDCDNRVSPTSIETDFGICEIIGGKWDNKRQELTLEWAIEFNRLKQKTLFRPKH